MTESMIIRVAWCNMGLYHGNNVMVQAEIFTSIMMDRLPASQTCREHRVCTTSLKQHDSALFEGLKTFDNFAYASSMLRRL